MIAFIDANRDEYGVETICTVLKQAGVSIAPSSYYAAKSRPASAGGVRGPLVSDFLLDPHRVVR